MEKINRLVIAFPLPPPNTLKKLHMQPCLNGECAEVNDQGDKRRAQGAQRVSLGRPRLDQRGC